jgi:hypothetical protein
MTIGAIEKKEILTEYEKGNKNFYSATDVFRIFYSCVQV